MRRLSRLAEGQSQQQRPSITSSSSVQNHQPAGHEGRQRPFASGNLLQLQQQIGNNQVQRLLAQRDDELDIEQLRQQMQQAQAHYNAGEWAAALEQFQSLYGIPHPEMRQHRPMMLWNLATCLQRLGRFDEAIVAYEEYLHHPNIQEAERTQALDRIRQNRMGQTDMTGDGNNPPPLSPDEMQAAWDTANERYNAGEWEGALIHFQAVYGHPHPDMAQHRPMMIWNIATCWQRLGQFDRAIAAYQEYIQQPGVQEADHNQALDRIRQSRMGQATGSLDQAEGNGDVDMDDVQARLQEGQARFMAGDWQAALNIFLALYGNPSPQLESSRTAFIWNIATCHQRLQQFDEAMSAYQEYLLRARATGSDRQEALERLRQCRLGEVGRNVQVTEGDEFSISGDEEMLFIGQVFFATGSHDLSSEGEETLRTVAAMVQARHQAEPNLTFRIAIVGGSSSRWRSATTEEESDVLNQMLSEQRATRAEGEMLALLPTEDVSGGVYQLMPEGMGDDMSEAAGLSPDSNLWTQRSVVITVWASEGAAQTAD